MQVYPEGLSVNVIIIHCPDELRVKYESAHRSNTSNGIKAMDYFMKKKTDHFNNAINT